MRRINAYKLYFMNFPPDVEDTHYTKEYAKDIATIRPKMPGFTDLEIFCAYSDWSDVCYCAGWMDLTFDHFHEFVHFLNSDVGHQDPNISLHGTPKCDEIMKIQAPPPAPSLHSILTKV